MSAFDYQSMRFSKHFILLDFLYDRDFYTFCQPLTLDDIWAREHEEAAMNLCNKLLEPLIELYGPCSVAGGFWPHIVQTPGGHYHTTPHFWDRRHGAGADVVWHNWVNNEFAPVDMAFDIDKNRHVSFDRIISYAGSEFLCMATKGTDRQRAALHENRRLGNGERRYISHSPRERQRMYAAEMQPTINWRRAPREPVHSTGRSVRAHHVRTGEYFVMLDFARNAQAIVDGVNTVPSVTNVNAIAACRMFSEVLDPVVREFGRVSVIRGIEPMNYGDDREHHWAAAVADLQPMRINFVLPTDTDPDDAMDVIEQHHSVLELEAFDHSSQSIEIELVIDPFDIQKTWVSHQENS